MRVVSFGSKVWGCKTLPAQIEWITKPCSRSPIRPASTPTDFTRVPSGHLGGVSSVNNRIWFPRTEGRE
jgi:hypothetical protein